MYDESSKLGNELNYMYMYNIFSDNFCFIKNKGAIFPSRISNYKYNLKALTKTILLTHFKTPIIKYLYINFKFLIQAIR